MQIQSVLIQLIDICNLHCPYCLRDDDALHGRAHALPIPLLSTILAQVRELGDAGDVQFTGGEPTLHPQFGDAIKLVHDMGWRFSFVTNGWTFINRALPHVLAFRGSLSVVSFSIDGVDRAGHDRLRGAGSFDRLMKAIMACHQYDLPFNLKVTFDRNKAPLLEAFATFAARLGARSLKVAPLFPTGREFVDDVLSIDEQREFMRRIVSLRSILKLDIQLAAGFYDPRPDPTCAPLRGGVLNIDYHGRLRLCDVLAGFRGQRKEEDIVADLRIQTIASALPALNHLATSQNQRRAQAFSDLGSRATRPSPLLGSSCLHCLKSFDKLQGGHLDSEDPKREMNDSLSFEVSDFVIASDFDGTEGLLLDTSTQRYHTLNETALFLWASLESGKTISQMTQALCDAFEVDAARARQSVERAVERLESQALIRRRVV